MRIFLRLITLLCILAAAFFPFGETFSQLFFVFIIAVFGIPHGAIDHLITQPALAGYNSLRTFIIGYLFVIFLVVVGWLIAPLTTFIIFILASAYHFGQSQLHYLSKSEGKLLKALLYTTWGLFSLGLIFIFNSEVVYNIIDSSLEFQNFGYYDLKIWSYNFIIFSGSTLAFLFLLRIIEGSLKIKGFLIELLDLGLLTLLFKFTPLLFSFSIYFGLWHSLNAMVSERKFLYRKYGLSSIRSFILKLLPFSIISLVGILTLIIISGYFSNSISPVMLFVIAISSLTFPHIISMEGMYGKLSSGYR